jgi:hypothetical protein
MISIVHNETVKAVEIYLDHKGVDVLIEKLQELKSSGNHLHLYVTNDERGLSAKSPYGESVVYEELILDLLPAEAWTDSDG